MADQTLAQTGALSEGTVQGRKRRSRAWRMVERGWNFGRAWVHYRLTGAHRGVPGALDLVLGDHFFAAWQVPDELRALGEVLATLRPKCALEIGTANGGTLLFTLCLASQRATIISVDLPGGQFGGGYGGHGKIRAWFYRRFAGRGRRICLLQGDSHSGEMLARVKSAIGGQNLDYLFIDGDHRYDGAKSDFEMYGPLVRKGGVIAFHDIVEGPPENVGGVPRFWQEMKSRYRHTEFVRDPQQGGLGIGVLYVE